MRSFFGKMISICIIAIGGVGVAFLIANSYSYNIEDVMFIEGMILLIVGVFTGMGGDSKGLSFQSIGQISSQYTTNANLEVTKMERSSLGKLKQNIEDIKSSSTIIISSIIIIIISNIY